MLRSGVSFILVAVLVAGVFPSIGRSDVPSSADLDNAAISDAETGWWTNALKTRDQRLARWREARFGCFIHWGAYSVYGGVWNGKNAGTYAEHLMRTQRIPLVEYKEKVVADFDPEKFDANQWVNLIKNAGMKYVVITAKHHDGFAMWPSKVNPYNIATCTKFNRDPMRELCDACRRNGIRFGFYYSHAFDWEDPDAPGNDWDYQNPGGDKGLFGGKQWYVEHPELIARVQRYVDRKAIPELLELIQMYHPDIFWFDTPEKLPLSLQLRIIKAVREADPDVVINGRAARAMGYNFGDYLDTADRPAEVRPTAGDWECIPTCNESYGYHQLDNKYKPPSYFIRLLAKAAAKGGNMLLNIGPMGNGLIDPHSTAILKGIGTWMSVNSDSIYGTQRTPLDRQPWGDSTVKGDKLYLHVFDWPADGNLVVGGLQSNISLAWLLADPSKHPLKFDRINPYDLDVQVPARPPDSVDSVVVLEISGEMKVHPGRLLATHDMANHLLAFDGETHGDNFTYGDGKAARYYVSGFDSPQDYMEWKIRTDVAAAFDVTVQYSTTHSDASVNLRLMLGDKMISGTASPTESATHIISLDLGQVQLPAGEETMRVGSDGAMGAKALQLFEVVLTPAK